MPNMQISYITTNY